MRQFFIRKKKKKTLALTHLEEDLFEQITTIIRKHILKESTLLQ